MPRQTKKPYTDLYGQEVNPGDRVLYCHDGVPRIANCLGGSSYNDGYIMVGDPSTIDIPELVIRMPEESDVPSLEDINAILTADRKFSLEEQ